MTDILAEMLPGTFDDTAVIVLKLSWWILVGVLAGICMLGLLLPRRDLVGEMISRDFGFDDGAVLPREPMNMPMPAVRPTRGEAAASADPLQRFLATRVRADLGAMVTARALYAAYDLWCICHEVAPVPEKMFAQWARNRFRWSFVGHGLIVYHDIVLASGPASPRAADAGRPAVPSRPAPISVNGGLR